MAADVGGHVVVLVTAPSREEARALGRLLVESKLAACANVAGSVNSCYWWEGKVETADEVLLILKTRAELVPPLAARVAEAHSYTIPEVVALPIVGGNPEYLAWIDASLAR